MVSSHISHEMHENSLAAYEANGFRFSLRSRMIAVVYARSGTPLTDREVGLKLGFADMNAVKPRISEMVRQGVLVECGKSWDPSTKATVRLCRLRPLKDQGELFG